MNSQNKLAVLAAIDVVVLCGGLGTRLREVIPDCPKALAPVGGRPFLDILVEELMGQGFRRFIFCVGHLKEQIIERYGARRDAEFVFSAEERPLGTGGAIKKALPIIRSNPFLVMNGDSYCRIEFGKLFQYHCERSPAATLVLTDPEGRRDGGLICTNADHKIISFEEKATLRTGECFINAGIYLLQTDVIGPERTATFSLEHDVFPALVKARPCFGFVVASPLVDIGTPERYRKADKTTWNAK